MNELIPKIENGRVIIGDSIIELPNIKIIDSFEPGANGIVFRGIDIYLNRDVVVKIWLPKIGDRRDKLKQGMSEAQKIAGLRHPNIVTIFSAGLTQGGMFYVVMELLPGVTLRNFLKDEHNLKSRYQIWRDIAEGVEYAHSMQVYHGDLHPGNVIIYNGRAKIIDFGTSVFVKRQGDSLTRERRLIVETFYKIFPEIDMLGLDEDNIESLKPELILNYCSSILEINMLQPSIIKNTKQKDYQELRRNLYHMATEIIECPLINPEEIIRWLRSMNVEEWYVSYALDHFTAGLSDYHIKDKNSSSVNPQEIPIEKKLKTIKQVYAKAKKRFIQRNKQQ